MKKKSCIRLMLVLVATVICIMAGSLIANAEISQDELYEYYLTTIPTANGERFGARIRRYLGTEEEIVFPQKIDGYDVIEICELYDSPDEINIDGSSLRNCTSVVIPEGVVNLLSSFQYMNVETAILSHSVENYNSAFSESKLKSIVIPEGKYSCFGTFMDCENLTNAVIQGKVIRSDYMLAGCKNLEEARFEDDITSLKETFRRCSNLKTLHLPEKIGSIDDAFIYCYNLKDIYYAGSECEWNQINKKFSYDQLANVTIHFGKEPDHQYIRTKIIKEATCQEHGSEEYICVGCKDKKTVETDYSDKHDYSDWSIKTEATCKTAGLKTRTCSVCSAIQEEFIPVTNEHSFSDWKVIEKATSTKSGKIQRVCSVCGKKETMTFEEADVGSTSTTVYVPTHSAHSYSKWVITKEATCKSEGERERTCSECNAKETDTIPRLSHDWSDWTVTKEMTPKEDGEKEKHCLLCGEIKTVTIPKAGHIYDEWKVVKDATCKEEGLMERTCSECGQKETKKIEKIKDHSFGDWITTKEPTCKEEGEKERICSECGQKETKKIEKLKDHTYGDWIITQEPTCKDEGEKERACSICGFKETEKIAKSKDHSFGDWEVESVATCKQKGISQRTCTVCGKIETQTYSKLKNHSFGDWIVITPASFNGEGLKERSCAICGTVENDVIPKLSLKTGMIIADVKSGGKYKVMAGNKTVAYKSPIDKEAVSVVIPDTIEYGGLSFKVTIIAANSFSGCNKLVAVTVGKNVKTIGKYAFRNCNMLCRLYIDSLKLNKIGPGILVGTDEYLIIKTPEKKRKAYQKLLKNKGQSKNTKII